MGKLYADIAQLRVDVLETDFLPEVHPYIPGTPLTTPSAVALPYPIHLSASQRLDFYTQRQGFNLLGMFKSPMMMMMALGGVMVFAMPYIMVRNVRCCLEGYSTHHFLRRKTLTQRFCKISKNGKRESMAFKALSLAAISSQGESLPQTLY